jgi:hypothetical protein
MFKRIILKLLHLLKGEIFVVVESDSDSNDISKIFLNKSDAEHYVNTKNKNSKRCSSFGIEEYMLSSKSDIKNINYIEIVCRYDITTKETSYNNKILITDSEEDEENYNKLNLVKGYSNSGGDTIVIIITRSLSDNFVLNPTNNTKLKILCKAYMTKINRDLESGRVFKIIRDEFESMYFDLDYLNIK